MKKTFRFFQTTIYQEKPSFLPLSNFLIRSQIKEKKKKKTTISPLSSNRPQQSSRSKKKKKPSNSPASKPESLSKTLLSKTTIVVSGPEFGTKAAFHDGEHSEHGASVLVRLWPSRKLLHRAEPRRRRRSDRRRRRRRGRRRGRRGGGRRLDGRGSRRERRRTETEARVLQATVSMPPGKGWRSMPAR